MSEPVYQEAFEAAISELTNLTALRRELDAKIEASNDAIACQRYAVVTLASLAEVDISSHPLLALLPNGNGSMTASIKLALRGIKGAVGATVVRDRLRETGFDIDRYNQPLATIHLVLKRLVKQGLVGQPSKNRYEWVSSEAKRP